MRNLKQFMLLLMMVSLVTITGCSSDDDNIVVPPVGGPEFLKADVGGSLFEAAQSPAVIVGAALSSGVLAIHGGLNNGSTIRITVANYNGVGTYATGNAITGVNSCQYLEISPAIASWDSGLGSFSAGLPAGSVEITSDDGTVVEGTFTFQGYNASDMSTKVVTNGSFKANIE